MYQKSKKEAQIVSQIAYHLFEYINFNAKVHAPMLHITTTTTTTFPLPDLHRIENKFKVSKCVQKTTKETFATHNERYSNNVCM